MSQTVCDWPVSYGSCSNVPEDFEEVREEFERMAIDFLWNLTGQRFGTCPEVVRLKDCAYVTSGDDVGGSLGITELDP